MTSIHVPDAGRIRTLRSSVFHSHLSVAIALAGGFALAPAHAQSISPADRATIEGSSSTSYPLGRHNARIQQLHGDLGTAVRTLNGHAYRRDAISTRGALADFQVDMSVSLSITATSPDQASRTFASNVGVTTDVLPRRVVSFAATNRPNQAPAPTFELRVPYLTPFAYPPGGGTLCLDTVIYGNDGPNGQNANFTAYLDAHEQFPDGRTIQPGYRYGTGCTAPGASSPAWASFELRSLPTTMEFEIDARNGMRTDASGNAISALIFGSQTVNVPWGANPQCSFLTSIENTWLLSGPNSTSGDWSGMWSAFAAPSIGTEFHVQVASAHPTNGVVLSDASSLVMPPPGPSPITATRIANGSDGTASTGTVSRVVPVTEFF